VLEAAESLAALPAPERLRLARDERFLPDIEPLAESALDDADGAVAVRALRGAHAGEQETVGAEDKVIDALLDLRVAPAPPAPARPRAGGGGGERTFDGGPPGSIFTHWRSLAMLVAYLAPRLGERWVDLGMGTGRLGFELAFRAPGVRFVGYEIVPARVALAQRAAAALGLPDTVRFVEQNLGDRSFELPAADTCFLYDPFSPATYARVVGGLRALAARQPLTIVAIGGANSYFRDAPWLRRHAAIGSSNFPPTVYRSL
jgi:hypothetical protein